MSKSNKKRRSHQSSRPYNSVPAFLLKTYEIIEAPTYNHLICWNKEGNAFIVKNANGFAEEVLPKYFKHNNFASFIRQLNMYDFHKTRHEENEDEFRHKYFKRGQKHLLSEIKRKTPEAGGETAHQLAQMEKTNEIHKIKREAQYFSKELSNLKGRQSELDKTVKMMYNQNTKLTDENKLIWGQLIKNKDKYEKKIEKLMMFIASVMQGGAGNALEGGFFKKSLPFSENALEKNEIAKMDNFEQFKQSFEGSNILGDNLSDKETDNSIQNLLKSRDEEHIPKEEDISIKTRDGARGYNLRSLRRDPMSFATRVEEPKKTNKRLYPIRKSTKELEPKEMPSKQIKVEPNHTTVNTNNPVSSVSTTSQVINFDKEVEPKLQPAPVGIMEQDNSAFGATSANQNRFMMPVDNDPFSLGFKSFPHASDEYDMSSVYPDNFKNTFKIEDKDESMLEDPSSFMNTSMNSSLNMNLTDDWPLTFKRTTSDRFK